MGKWKTKQLKGLGNKNSLPFPKTDSLKYWRLKSNYMSIQYVNQLESLSWSFSNLPLKKVHACADNMKLYTAGAGCIEKSD